MARKPRKVKSSETTVFDFVWRHDPSDPTNRHLYRASRSDGAWTDFVWDREHDVFSRRALPSELGLTVVHISDLDKSAITLKSLEGKLKVSEGSLDERALPDLTMEHWDAANAWLSEDNVSRPSANEMKVYTSATNDPGQKVSWWKLNSNRLITAAILLVVVITWIVLFVVL